MEQQMPKDEAARDLVSMHQWTSPYLARPLQVSTLDIEHGVSQHLNFCRHIRFVCSGLQQALPLLKSLFLPLY